MTHPLLMRGVALVVLAAFGSVATLPHIATSAFAASGACATRLISTKRHNSGVCVRYVHTILIGDGIELEKPSTSTHFTRTSRSAVKRFQAEQSGTIRSITGKGGPFDLERAVRGRGETAA